MAYQSRNGQGNNISADNGNTEPTAKEQRDQASAKLAKTAAKGAATYAAGPLGGKAVDLAAKTKAGQSLLNAGGKALNTMPGMGRAAKSLDDHGITDTVDKGIDALGGNVGKGNMNPTPAKEIGKGDVNLPSSASNTPQSPDGKPKIAGTGPYVRDSGGSDILGDDKKDKNDSVNGLGKASFKVMLRLAIMFIAPFVIVIFLIILLLAALAGGMIQGYEDMLGASYASGEETGDIVYSENNADAQKFYERVNKVKLKYQAQGKSVDAHKIVAVYHVLNNNGADLSYSDMGESEISEIADAMFNGNSYDEDTFRENLINYIIPKYLPNAVDAEVEEMADSIFTYIDDYYDFIGYTNNSSSCASMGSCAYDIKGFHINGNNVAKPMKIKNLKVRLMQCGGAFGNGSYTTPIDQDLVDFEEYVAGVAYAEIGDYAPDEALKAQMVAARSYALARPTAMGNALGKKLEEENGQWILQISSCVADQVFCNINEGCSYMGGGDGQGGYVPSGKVPGATRTRPPLPEGHKLRTAAAATQGEVLVNSQGYIISAGYLQTEQNKFTSLAKSGLNYKQILLQVYNQGSRNYGASDIQKMSCNDGSGSGCAQASTGDFANWKQYEGEWVGVKLGNSGKTIKQIGCLATSVSMLIAKSKVPTNINNFNPGTFVEYLNSHGGFVSGGNFVWSAASLAAPTFKYQGKISVAGMSREQKLNKIKELLNQNAYVVAEVKGNTGQHWVAIDGVSGNSVIMMDPGSASTDMWTQYAWGNTSQLAYFKVG